MLSRASAAILALFAAASLAVLACGGSDDNNNSNTSSNSTPAATQPAVNATLPGGLTGIPTLPPNVATLVPQVTIAQGAGAGVACGLVTQQDASTALGVAVQAPLGTTIGTQQLGPGLTASISSCLFDTMTGRSVTVSAYQFPGANSGQLRPIFEQIICPQGKERVSGLGDVACWNDASHKELQFIKNTTYADVLITEPQAQDRTQAIRDLAGKIAARIQ